MSIRPPSSGWWRVAAGLEQVVKAAGDHAAVDSSVLAARLTQHSVELVRSVQVAVGSRLNGGSSSFEDHQSNGWNDSNNMVRTSSSKMTDLSHNTSTPANAIGIRQIDSSKNSVSTKDTHSELENTETLPIDCTEVADSRSRSVTTDDQVEFEENKIRLTTSPEDTDSRIREGRPVPSTRIGRAAGFASLGFSLALGTAVEGVSRLFGGPGDSSSSLIVNNANSDRLAASLCRMRGAALKMGQMLSIQDESLLPPALSRALRQVRQGADAMPNFQLQRQLEAQLGKDWRSKFETFDEIPFAAASIGQVHRASMKTEGSLGVKDVVVKVQYPGVGQSIESDLRNLSMLVTLSGLAPKGLFIENVIRVGEQELKVECDYKREMLNQRRIKQLVESDSTLRANNFVVPDVIDDLTSDEVITSEYMPGGTIDKVANLDQEERNRIGRTIMYLTMKELFVWRFMQTDPNWGNFLYDIGSQTTSLIDFGATREYSKQFVDGYLRIVWASSNRDEATLMEQSHRMNFLTGEENDDMLRAHKLSGFTVGEPFASNEPFDFRGSNISTRMGEHTAVFLKHRLTPPPEEVYTLHRKLAGAYMLCIKLGAVIQCRDLLENIMASHHFEDGLDPPSL